MTAQRWLAHPALAPRVAAARGWWRGLAARERRLLVGAGVVLTAFLVWRTAVQPAWRTLASAPAQIDALDLQLQGMQRLAAEAVELRAAPPLAPAQSVAALQAATARLGDHGKLSVQGERAVLTLSGVGTSELRDWLADARSGARARPLEATLSRAAQGYSGTLVVSIGGAP